MSDIKGSEKAPEKSDAKGEQTQTRFGTTAGEKADVDAGAALATIASSLSSIANQAQATQAAPPPSTETRPGGKFRVNDQLVDAEGRPIKDEDDKDKAK